MILQSLTVTLILIAGLIGFESLARLTQVSQSFIRKLVHVSMGLTVVAITYFVDYKVFIWSAIIFTIILIAARKYYRLFSLRDRQDKSWGEVFFPIGIGMTALLAPTATIFAVSVLIMTLGDTAAYVFGDAFPRSHVILPGRTIAGSGANLFVTLAILLSFGIDPVPAAIATSGVVIAEILSIRGLDNLMMPLVATVILTLFH